VYLIVAVGGVCEDKLTASRRPGNVVERVELSTKEVVAEKRDPGKDEVSFS
jgi:hypothetical protein